MASEACEETTECIAWANDKAVATSPPLGGASEYFHGRSSDSTGSNLLDVLHRPFGPVSSWAFVPAYRCGAVPESHRIPFSSSSRRNLGIGPLYLDVNVSTSPFLVDMWDEPNRARSKCTLMSFPVGKGQIVRNGMYELICGCCKTHIQKALFDRIFQRAKLEEWSGRLDSN